MFSVIARRVIGAQRLLAVIIFVISAVYFAATATAAQLTPAGPLVSWDGLGAFFLILWLVWLGISGLYLAWEAKQLRVGSVALIVLLLVSLWCYRGVIIFPTEIWLPQHATFSALRAWFTFPLTIILAIVEICLPPWPWRKNTQGLRPAF